MKQDSLRSLRPLPGRWGFSGAVRETAYDYHIRRVRTSQFDFTLI